MDSALLEECNFLHPLCKLTSNRKATQRGVSRMSDNISYYLEYCDDPEQDDWVILDKIKIEEIDNARSYANNFLKCKKKGSRCRIIEKVIHISTLEEIIK